MKRPTEVVLSAIVLLLGSLFQFVMAGVMALDGLIMPKGAAGVCYETPGSFLKERSLRGASDC